MIKMTKKQITGLIFAILGTDRLIPTIILIIIICLFIYSYSQNPIELCLKFSTDTIALSIDDDIIFEGGPTKIESDAYNKDDLLTEIKDFYIFKNAYKDISLFPDIINDGELSFYRRVYPSSYIGKKSGDELLTYQAEIYLHWNASYSSFYKALSTSFLLEGTIYSENLFSFPSIIFVYNFEGTFSYMLFDESSLSLTYVFLKNIRTADNIVFNKEDSPKKCLLDSDVYKMASVFKNGNDYVHSYHHTFKN